MVAMETREDYLVNRVWVILAFFRCKGTDWIATLLTCRERMGLRISRVINFKNRIYLSVPH